MIRAIWVTIGIALLVCIVMCTIRDWQGDEQAAYAWAGACIGLGLVALLMYGIEYAPRRQLIDGRPMSDFEGRPWYDEREVPTVYDRTVSDRQPLDTMD